MVNVAVVVAIFSLQILFLETEKAVLSTVVCIMMFSTSEDVPLPVYGEWVWLSS